MPQQETTEELRRRFRELAAELSRVHDQWREVAARDDLAAENRLIREETELLARIDEVISEFRTRLPGHPSSK